MAVLRRQAEAVSCHGQMDLIRSPHSFVLHQTISRRSNAWSQRMLISYNLHLLVALVQRANRQGAAHRGRLGFRVLGLFAARRTGRGAIGGLLGISVRFLNDAHFLRKVRGPFLYRQHCEGAIREVRHTLRGRLTIQCGLLFHSPFLGPLLDYSCACAEGEKLGSPSITSFHHSRAKQESFLVRTRQFT